MIKNDQNAGFKEPQHRYQRPRRSRRSSAQPQSTSDSQAESAANAAGAVLGSATNTLITGGQFTAAPNVNRNVTINISEGVAPQTHSENRSGRGHNRRRGQRRPQLSRTDPAQRSNEIYERHLRMKKRGHPLWIPQPNMVLPIPYRAQGVRIGDVGLFTENGGFDFLFNICVPRDDPINPQELPDEFHPISPSVNPTDIRKFAEFSPGSYLASSSIAESRTADSRSSGLTFESSASEGAILAMPEGAYSEDLSNLSRFRKYIATHAEDWYRFVNGPRGREAQNGDLRVVVGSDKTTSWGMATFADSTLSEDTNFRLKFSAEQPSPWNGGKSYAWEHSGVAEVRVGPGNSENQELGETDSSRLRNQSLFLRTLNVTLAKNVWEENFLQTVVVTDQKDFHSGVQNQSIPSAHGSRTGSVHAQPSQTHLPQNLPFRSYSSTNVLESISALAYELADDEETSGQISAHISPGLSEYKEIQCDAASMPNVIWTRSSSSNDVLHPSNIINQYLLEQNPHARVAVTHDRDWSNIISMDSDSSQMLSEVLAMNDIVLDNDAGLVFLELKENNQNAQGLFAEEAKLAELIESIKDGKLTLDQYLFGFHGDHCLRLRFLCTALRSGSTNQPISKSPFLIGHPERPLSLDEILKICNGDGEGSTQRQPLLGLRAKLNPSRSQHADRSSCLLRLGDALSRRFNQWGQRDDLEEAIWCYEEALSLLPNSHYQYLETLLGLCSAIYRRFCLLDHANDLENLLRYLELEHDVLNQRRLLLVAVDAQLKKLHPDSKSIGNSESQDIMKESRIECFDRISDGSAIPDLTNSVHEFNLLDPQLNSNSFVTKLSSTIRLPIPLHISNQIEVNESEDRKKNATHDRAVEELAIGVGRSGLICRGTCKAATCRTRGCFENVTNEGSLIIRQSTSKVHGRMHSMDVSQQPSSSCQSNMSSRYSIPDLLVTWPWKRLINPALAEVKDESNAWVESLGLFEPAQLRKLNVCDFNLLAALVAPQQDKEHLRIACDLMNFYFAFDENMDLANRKEVSKILDDVINAFRYRDASVHSSHGKIITMAQEFFQRTVDVVGEDRPAMERFISDFDAYTKSIIQEAEDRVADQQRTVDDCILLRRDTCGGKPTFSFFGLGLNIPDAVFDNPIMISVIENATDLIAITNDMHSYRLERSRGLESHNIITAIMEGYNLDLQQALYWLSGYASKTIFNFLANIRALPSWGEKIDRAVMVYIDRVARCVRGYDAWSYETNRYYGDNGLKVQECRKINLLPPDDGYITREELELEIVVA